jgi:hypothetical protein
VATGPRWVNPITVNPGAVQSGVDPARLRPSRTDLVRSRLEFQRALLRSGRSRFTMIQASRDGVIIDGHHGVRAAVEEGRPVDVSVSALSALASATSILDLDVR